MGVPYSKNVLCFLLQKMYSSVQKRVFKLQFLSVGEILVIINFIYQAFLGYSDCCVNLWTDIFSAENCCYQKEG